MNIGKLAKQADVNIQTIRYYEKIGILKPTHRLESGYRVYEEESLRRLRFIKRGQELGFTLDEIKELLSLRSTSPSGRQKARSKAIGKIADIREKISYLRKLESNLKKLVSDCEHGAVTSPCPILEKMEVHS